MRKNRSGYIKDLLVPCFIFSAITGVATALLVFIFKLLASFVISASVNAYSYVRAHIALLPVLVSVAALIGLISALILKRASGCRGGGIPTAVAALRGLIPMEWIKSAFVLPLCALMSFLCGVPLGNEGPCVQMGTALGEGTVRTFGKRNKAWRRYIMTGGACAGFSAATGAPVTGILFAVEEAHRRFSPMLFMAASVAVVASHATLSLLGAITGIETSMFHFTVSTALPLKYIWAAVLVGFVCGICALFFTRAYRACAGLVKRTLSRVPLAVKFIAIFVTVAVVGFFSADCIGSGHSLIDVLIDGGGVWYLLIICFAIRALLLMLANNVGVTGGLFIPTLAFGAILGALCGKAMTAIGIMGDQYYPILVVVGMSAFLGASSRTPITACVFALEALCDAANILPVAIGVTVAFLVIETVGIESFNDTVIESKAQAHHAGKTAQIFDVYLTVKPRAFVIEKEIRDILWPPTCAVLSVDRSDNATSSVGLSEGDVLHVHYQTFEPHGTFEELEALVGRQDESVRVRVHEGSEKHQVPEI